MSKDLKSREAFLIMDCASWHKSKNLKIPGNITIIYLPPYSPGLNPAERLWQYIKHNILRNKIYDSIGLLEDILCEFIASLSRTIVKQVCLLLICLANKRNWYKAIQRTRTSKM